MSAIREALGWVGTGYAVLSDSDLRDAALAEVEAMERVVEAARRVREADNQSLGQLGDEGFQAQLEMENALDGLLAALAELDGQHSNAAVTNRESACCGDPGDCGENCG